MAKNAVSDWSEIAANNTDVGGVNIGEGSLARLFNNSVREMMAQIATETIAIRNLIGSTALETTADLTNYTRVSGQTVVRTLGNSTSTDGEGYGWYYDASDTTSTTSFPGVVVGADDARWKNAGPYYANTLAKAQNLAAVLPTGTVFPVLGETTAGDGGGFMGKVEAASSSSYPGSGIVSVVYRFPIASSTYRTPNQKLNSFNKLASDATSCRVDSGSDSQPNFIGYEGDWGTFDGDGSTVAFDISPGFTVNDLTRENIRIGLIRDSDNVRFPQEEDSDFTISGYGTTTATATFSTAPTTSETVWWRIIGEDESGDAPLLNFITRGYDNTTDGDGPMTIMDGAHHTDFANPGGHNFFKGGSYNQMVDGCNYSTVEGHDNWLETVTLGSVRGSRNRCSTGQSVDVAGAANTTSEDFVHVVGYKNNAAHIHAAASGRQAVSRHGGHNVFGIGLSSDTANGSHQYGDIGWQKTTSDATEGFMSAIDGDSLLDLPNDSTVVFKVTILGSNATDTASWELTGTYIKVGSGTPSLVGSVTKTALAASSGATSGSWDCRLQPAGGGIYTRMTGAAATNINWVAKSELLEIAHTL